MKFLKIITLFSAITFSAWGTVSAQAQTTQSLSIGDPAPPLQYAKWIQGTDTITELDQDKVYVIEFWATWCGPCIAAMPHLSELAKKYEGKVTFIGCDVWENNYGGNKDQESYLPKVTKFVEDQFKMGRLTYNVIADNTAEDMGNKWLKAAGERGIPSSFVVQKGNIAWIGHPTYLDSILVEIDKGTYDYKIEKTKKEERLQRAAAAAAGHNAAMKAYKDAETAKDYEKALVLIDKAISDFPKQSYMFVGDRFMLLLKHFSVDKALTYGKEMQKEKLPGQLVVVKIYETEGLPKSVYLFAIDAIKSWKMGGNAKVLDVQATLEARAGLFKEAAATQQKAVETAKNEKNNPGITEGVINDYQKKADEYKEKAKN